MQRVLMLTTFYPPFSFGGDAVDMQALARALARRGCEVTVVHDEDAYVALADAPPARGHDADSPVEIIGLRSRLKRFGLLLAHQTGRPIVHGARLRRLCAERRFDTVIFGNVSLLGGPGLFSICPDAVHAYIATEHWLVCPTHVLWRYDGQPCDERRCLRCTLRHRRPPQLWRHSGLLARAARHIDVFVARSEFSRRKHREYGFAAPMEVVPPCVPAPASTADLPTPHHRPYFLFAGRVEQLKGLADVLPLFAHDRGADLVVAGTGAAETTFRNATRSVPHIRWLGFVPHPEMSRWYRHAIALVMPSTTYETFGIVVIEAMSHGAPVVARRRGPLPELMARGGGLGFDSVADLDEALRVLLEQPDLRQRLSDEAQRSFQENWHEDVVVPRFVDIVEGARSRRAAARLARRGAAQAPA